MVKYDKKGIGFTEIMILEMEHPGLEKVFNYIISHNTLPKRLTLKLIRLLLDIMH